MGSTREGLAERRRRVDGERSRRLILEEAARLATVEGLDRLSIARVAEAAGMSKSGVFGLFGSKEELQLATVERAREVFVETVVRPALESEPGLARLRVLCEGFLDYVERRVFPGGCFFASVAAEVGARPGPVRDRVAREQGRWVALLAESAREAVELRELASGTDPDQLALELSALLTGVDIAYLLHGDAGILRRARVAVAGRLGE